MHYLFLLLSKYVKQLFLSDPIRHASSEGVCQSLQTISSEQSATSPPSVSFTEPMNIPG
jgi:hypothetical protein